jgi:acyl-CoA thioesterase-1
VHIISCRDRFRSLVFLVLLATACGEPSLQETTPPAYPLPTTTTSAPRVVFLGDSLSAGLGLAEADAFPAVVQSLLQETGYFVEIVNAGVSGDTSAGGLARLDWVLGQKTEILVVELGGNDALRGQSLENTEENLRQIVRRGRQAGAGVLLLGMDIPTNYGPDYGTAFAEMYVRIADEEGATLVPGFVREGGADPTLMQADGLHPTEEGHRRLAEILVPYLERAVADLRARTATPRRRQSSVVLPCRAGVPLRM